VKALYVSDNQLCGSGHCRRRKREKMKKRDMRKDKSKEG
jgi:hypothetical protein